MSIQHNGIWPLKIKLVMKNVTHTHTLKLIICMYSESHVSGCNLASVLSRKWLLGMDPGERSYENSS